MNTGNAIYGFLGATLLFWALTALIIFLFLWEFSRTFMLRVLGWGLGLGITVTFKWLLTQTCRMNYSGFYRTHPKSYNIGMLALECWFIGLGAYVLVSRVCQFLLAAAFWVGRTDVPYLAQNVNIGGFGFDMVPVHFVKELLIHEAHRHPYIERITQMCLMRLKTRKFVSPAGAAWRQVFIQAFMPWMKKHRVFHEARIYAALRARDLRKEELEEESKTITTRFMEDMKHASVEVTHGISYAGDHVLTGTAAIMKGAKSGAEAITSLGHERVAKTTAEGPNVTHSTVDTCPAELAPNDAASAMEGAAPVLQGLSIGKGMFALRNSSTLTEDSIHESGLECGTEPVPEDDELDEHLLEL